MIQPQLGTSVTCHLRARARAVAGLPLHWLHGPEVAVATALSRCDASLATINRCKSSRGNFAISSFDKTSLRATRTRKGSSTSSSQWYFRAIAICFTGSSLGWAAFSFWTAVLRRSVISYLSARTRIETHCSASRYTALPGSLYI